MPDRAVWLRALFLEIECVANHLGDLGYPDNDVALSFGFMPFWRLKEDWLRLIRDLRARLPTGDLHAPLAAAQNVCEGLGWVEGWRGEVVVALRIGADGRIDRMHPHDPSWQNWPQPEVGILGNIVPDFPLIDKSFNCSCSGTD